MVETPPHEVPVEQGAFLPGMPESPKAMPTTCSSAENLLLREAPMLIQDVPQTREFAVQQRRSRWIDHPLDWLLGTRPGRAFVFTATGLALLGSGALTWSLVGGNADFDTSFWQSLWISWGLFFDPGTQTGVPATDPLKVQFTAMFFSVCGFIFNMCVLGTVVETIHTTLERVERVRSRIVTNGHTLILGWGDKTLCLVDELRHVYNQQTADTRKTYKCCSRRARNQELVILCQRPVEEVEQEVVEHLSASGTSAECILYREGNPADPMELTKVSATSASDVIVVSRHTSADLADQEVIQTVVTLASLPNAATSDWEVWAEMRINENVEVVGALLPGCQGIVARQAVNRMFCLSGIFPSVGFCYVELASFKTGSQVYVSRAPKAWIGRSLGDVCTDAPHPVVLLGIGAGEALQFKADWQIQEDDPIALLAFSSADVDHLFANEANYEPRSFCHMRCCTTALRMEYSDVGSGPISPDADQPKVVLLLGCPEDIADFLTIMNLYLAAGSKVYILSERDLEWRRRELNFAYNGGFDDGTEGKQLQLQNLELHHVVGPATAKRHIGRLPLEEADAVIILSEHHEEDDDPAMASDSRCLNSLVTLRSLCSGKQGRGLGASRPERFVPVLFEIIDSRTERVVRANAELNKLGTPFFSNALETSIFAMASEDRAVFNTFSVMLQPSNFSNIVVKDVEGVLTAEEMDRDHRFFSFMDLQRRVIQDTGAVLLGWRRCGGKIELNPPHKEAKLPWARGRGDMLVIFTGGDATPRGAKAETPVVPIAQLGKATE